MKLQILKELQDIIQEYQQTNLQVNLKSQEYFSYKSDYLAPVYTNNNNCHSHQGQINIKELFNFQTLNHNQNFLLSQKHNILYKLSPKELTLYKWIQSLNENTFQYKIKQYNHIDLAKQCPVTMVMDNKQDILYIFSCQGIKMLTSTLLTSSFQQIILYQQNLFFQGTMVKLKGDLIFWMSPTQGLKIFGLQINGNLKQIDNISAYSLNRSSIKIIYFQYHNEHLFLLSQKQGIQSLIEVNNKFEYVNELEFQPQFQKTSHQMIIYQNSLFVSVSANNYYFVVQIQLNSLFLEENQFQFSLVRYYKGFKYISNIQIFNQKLIIFSDRGVQLYPINQDPRKISALMNGVANNHFKGVINAKFLKQSLFAIIQKGRIKIIQIQIVSPYIECRFQPGAYYLQIRELCNSINKRRYFQHCQKYAKLNITVSNSSNSYQWIFILVLSICMVVLCAWGLIYWRKHKQTIIQTIIAQISKLQTKQMTKIQFVQAQQQKKARSRDWNQFKDQISFENSPKQHIQQIDPQFSDQEQRK